MVFSFGTFIALVNVIYSQVLETFVAFSWYSIDIALYSVMTYFLKINICAEHVPSSRFSAGLFLSKS